MSGKVCSAVFCLTMSGVLFAVPDKVWNLNSPDDNNTDTRYDLDNSNEDDLWWNQKTLTSLDLSSNALVEISSDVQNLLDLTVLNVSDEFVAVTLKSFFFQLIKATSFDFSSFKTMH